MSIGIVIVLVIIILGLSSFAMAVSFMVKPTEVKLAVIRPLSIATTFASVAGLSSGLATALTNISGQLGGRSGLVNVAMLAGGISEALVAAVFGFSLLTLAWIAVALGMRKHI